MCHPLRVELSMTLALTRYSSPAAIACSRLACREMRTGARLVIVTPRRGFGVIGGHYTPQLRNEFIGCAARVSALCVTRFNRNGLSAVFTAQSD